MVRQFQDRKHESVLTVIRFTLLFIKLVILLHNCQDHSAYILQHFPSMATPDFQEMKKNFQAANAMALVVVVMQFLILYVGTNRHRVGHTIFIAIMHILGSYMYGVGGQWQLQNIWTVFHIFSLVPLASLLQGLMLIVFPIMRQQIDSESFLVIISYAYLWLYFQKIQLIVSSSIISNNQYSHMFIYMPPRSWTGFILLFFKMIFLIPLLRRDESLMDSSNLTLTMVHLLLLAYNVDALLKQSKKVDWICIFLDGCGMICLALDSQYGPINYLKFFGLVLFKILPIVIVGSMLLILKQNRDRAIRFLMEQRLAGG